MNKAELRSDMLKKRSSLMAEDVKKASESFFHLLIHLPVYQKSRVILSYMPYGNEADLLPVNQKILEDGRSLLIPRVIDRTEMEAVRIHSLKSGLIESYYGVKEPDSTYEAVDPRDIDLVLVPGLAFDQYGNRLGHGKGYYDRFLEKCGKQAFFLGVAYSFQVFDRIPFEAYDKKVHGLITEKTFLLV